MPRRKKTAPPLGRPREATPPTALAALLVKARRGRDVDTLAQAVGVTRAAWYHWENGQRKPPLERLPSIALALGISQAKLIAAALA